ncbi:MAG: DUF115 domain-containing protein [Treponema sp.]|jgi:hypothetical protein|nr:DUF115 domain-containing protein [Treponema sp.]
MDRRFYFERNLLALSIHDPALCSRLSGAETTLGRYRFPEARTGDIVPALVDLSGEAHPLHSMVDPKREGERLVSTLNGEGFLIFLGLGGGYAAKAALARADVSRALTIEYDINGAAELLCSREYIGLFGDSRFTLLVDPPPEAIAAFILAHYRPALAGGIKTFPLRTRTERDIPRFTAAAEAVQQAIEKVSSDYSVQAHFGGRWFSNIIHNLKAAETQNRSAPPIREAAICAAGPSLDEQLPLLAERRSGPESANRRPFIISADTALPALLKSGLAPDAVVTIDCQHISYYHFIGAFPGDIPLFLDIASPPLLAGLSRSPFFFSGGHPLAAYISRNWRPFPQIDTSGGNVTHACLSLAENLGAERITVYGADFSYSQGRIYARGTYIYPFFERKQTRLAPLEACRSAFLYRAPFLAPEEGGQSGRYETAALRFYRLAFEEKAAAMAAEIIPTPGIGVPILIARRPGPREQSRTLKLFASGAAITSSAAFLNRYRAAIAALPLPGAETGRYLEKLDNDERQVLTTLLPQTAAVKRRRPDFGLEELIKEVKDQSVNRIDRVLTSSPQASGR